MLVIKTASYLDYIFFFGGERTAYSDYSVKNALESGGKLYFMYEDKYAVGYICVAIEDNSSRIFYAYTKKENRNKGVLKRLLRHVAENARFSVRLNISEKQKYYRYVSSACRSAGFSLQSSCIVFSGYSRDFFRWDDYMLNTGNRYIHMFEKWGFICTSFREADESIIDEIYYSDENEYENSLSVKPFFDCKSRCMDMDMSFAAIKDGHVAAYTLVSRPYKDGVVFEQISTSRRYMQTGIVLFPFVRAMDKFKEFGCKAVSYAMYEDNVQSNSFREKIINMLTSSRVRTYNYVYNK